MKLKIKDEYLDGGLYCPLRKVEVSIRFIEPEMYQYYFDRGYSHIFDVEVETPVIQKTSSKTIKPDLYDLPE